MIPYPIRTQVKFVKERLFQMALIKENYTRKVSGDAFDYELEYTPGADVGWIARVYHGGVLKGSPHGALTANVLSGPALEQYLRAYVEGMIERGLDVAE